MIEILIWTVGILLFFAALWVTTVVLVGIGLGLEKVIRKLGERSEDRRRARRIIGEYRGW